MNRFATESAARLQARPATLITAVRRSPIVLLLSWLLVLGILVMLVFGDLLAPDPTRQDLSAALLPPASPGHLLGTDQLGRDVLALLIAGTRSAIIGPIIIAVGSALTGVVFGLAAGYLRGPFDQVVSRVVELLMSLPLILVAIVVGGFLGAGYWATVLIILVLSFPSDTRLARGITLEQAALPYVQAARVIGVSTPRILFVHILPNILPVLVTNLVLTIAFSLGSLSALSFLGIGVPPGTPDWGRLLADGRAFIFDNPAGVVAPGLLIILTACAINLIGDSLLQREQRGAASR